MTGGKPAPHPAFPVRVDEARRVGNGPRASRPLRDEPARTAVGNG